MAFNRIKELVDEGIPPVVTYDKHAVTVIGYYEDKDGKYLLVYDNNYPNSTVIWSVYDRYVEIWGKKYYEVEVVEPKSKFTEISKRDIIIGIIEYIYKDFTGLTFHSPIDVVVESSRGEVLRIVNDEVVENSIEDSYVYVSEDLKTMLLPSDRNYDVKVTSREECEINMESILQVENEVTIGSYKNIDLQEGSKLSLNILSGELPEAVYVDIDADEVVDFTVEPVISTPLQSMRATVGGEVTSSDTLILSLVTALVTLTLVFIIALIVKKL